MELMKSRKKGNNMKIPINKIIIFILSAVFVFLALGKIKLAETNDVIQITIAIQNKSHSHIATDNIKKYFIYLNLL